MKTKKNLLDKTSIGSWITLSDPCVTEVMANAGFEWLVVDIEHTSLDLEKTRLLISSIQSQGLKAFVRVSKNEEVVIKRVLDAGADGIIVPMINSAAAAAEAVAYSKYPPEGKRGVGLYRAQGYGLTFESYKQWVRDELIIVAQIEHIDAVNNIEEIICVDGIDAVLIGPYDLSGSMGCPGDFGNTAVQEAIEKVVNACRAYNFPAGFHVVDSNPAALQHKIDLGCTFLAYGIDYMFMRDAARQGMQTLNLSRRTS